MSRPIDANALREQLQWRAYDDWNQGVVTSWADAYREVIDMIDDMPSVEPSAQPEIIRCNSCKHWKQITGKMRGFGVGKCYFNSAKLVANNGFCCWAERREG